MNVADRTRERELPVLQGSVVAVAIDAKHRFRKTPRLSIILTTGNGVEGDAHYGEFVGHRYLARRNPRVWSIRTKLQIEGRARDLAMFNLAIDSKLRGCDVVAIRVEDVAGGGYTADRATVRQRKTGRPVRFELASRPAGRSMTI